MIVYDKEQKQIVIPNGLGNIDIYNNGVEAGYNEGYEQGQADIAANARVLEVTKNGVYGSEVSDPIIPDVTGRYADGTEFYDYAELTGIQYNTGIKVSKNTKLEIWYKPKDFTFRNNGGLIGTENTNDIKNFSLYTYLNRGFAGKILTTHHNYTPKDPNKWFHLELSLNEGFFVDGVNYGTYQVDGILSNKDIYINKYDASADGYFGMIKINDTIIIPTADGFLNTNTGELLEVVRDGKYTFIKNEPIYGEGELIKTVYVNVPDLNGSYDEGYAQGKTDGIDEQKAKLESINITENGTYTKEDGYNHIEVNVPDLNGSYDEGYEQGQADVAANARVLDVTENGNYLSKFSDPVIPTLVTGVYADGTDFYSYAELNGKVFNTNIPATMDSRVELWYKGDNLKSGDGYNNIIATTDTNNSNIFEIIYWASNNNNVRARIGSSYVSANWDETKWHHIIVSVSDGFVIDGEKKGDIQSNSSIPNGRFTINGTYDLNSLRNANGCFGMIKIDNTIIIPTADGFLNTNTGELLEVVKNGAYTYTENVPTYGEGELYKTINVNVIPKINLQKTGLKLGYSRFTEVPEWVDFEGITDMERMFSDCGNLTTVPLFDTSNVTNMGYMFYYCTSLIAVPLFDTSKITNTENMFANCNKLTTIPQFDTSKVTNMNDMFYYCSSLTSLPALNAQSLNMYTFLGIFGFIDLPKLTDFGGFLNLKQRLTSDNNLKRLPNLTKESCINILNGLYDFVAAGETPNDNQGQLKVHQNFLDKVGDEISIGINKGWQITV